MNFFDGLAWMSQLLLFLTLGLLVNPRELIPVLIPGLIISFIMIFVTRPITVFLCLAPFRKMPVRDKTFVSWVGLRGAVPIVFAILPLAAEVPHARLIFNCNSREECIVNHLVHVDQAEPDTGHPVSAG